MPWGPRSSRTAPLPPDWAALRAAQLDRDDHRCAWLDANGRRCFAPATDVDHYGHTNDHTRLRSLCRPHHAHRTAVQARTTYLARRHRPPEPHPGQITGA